jgi:hypothetical protein
LLRESRSWRYSRRKILRSDELSGLTLPRPKRKSATRACFFRPASWAAVIGESLNVGVFAGRSVQNRLALSVGNWGSREVSLPMCSDQRFNARDSCHH